MFTQQKRKMEIKKEGVHPIYHIGSIYLEKPVYCIPTRREAHAVKHEQRRRFPRPEVSLGVMKTFRGAKNGYYQKSGR